MTRLDTILYTVGVFAFGAAMGIELMTMKVLGVMNWWTYNPTFQPQAAEIAGYYHTTTSILLPVVAASLIAWVYRQHFQGGFL